MPFALPPSPRAAAAAAEHVSTMHPSQHTEPHLFSLLVVADHDVGHAQVSQRHGAHTEQ